MRLGLRPAVLLSLLAAACGDSRSPTEASPGSIRVVALSTAQVRGNAVMLDLVNDSTVAISTNACPEGLERRVGSGWSRLASYEIGCYTVQVGVLSGARGRLIAPLPATLERGIYRSVHNISSGNHRIGYLIRSTPFEVR